MTDAAPSYQEIKLGKTSSLRYYSDFIHSKDSGQLIERCRNELDWVQSEISLFGKRVPIPRLNAWYGDHAYSYSGTRFEPCAWPDLLIGIKNQIEQISGLSFNSVLVNWYRDGSDSMGWHSDNEISLGENPQIASVSLGDTRRFLLRKVLDKSKKYKLELEDGSLLLMLGEIQSLWQHSIPRTAKSKQSRINLTFRQIHSSNSTDE